MKNLKLILTGAFLATLSSCTNPDSYRTPDFNGICNDLTPTKTVEDITSSSTSTPQKYTEDDVIEAYVTSSDEGGNFYKSISFISTDGNLGFSMPIDDYNLYTKFEPGRKVYINMKDRYFFKQYGSTVIGSFYNGGTPDIDPNINPDLPDPNLDNSVGRISGIEYASVITASCATKVNESDIIKKLSIKDAKNDKYLNMLIEFDNVQFTDEFLGKNYFDANNQIGGATNNLIKDASGSTVILRASQYATFASEPIPSNSGKIIGVMTKYRNDYQFMIRTINDVQLNTPRIVPFFEESFSTNFPNWLKINVNGTQVWTLDTTFGNPGSCAKMSGFANSTNNINEDWLISPVQNLSSLSAATLTFETATRFAGNPLTVLISKNYSGTGNPNSATWTPLSGTLAPVNGPSYVWTASGPININSYTGPGNNAVYIAFKYTSTASASATWEVDNVKITGN